MQKIKSYYLRYILIVLSVVFIGYSKVSADCSSPPTNGWGAGYSAFAAWCRQCGGTPYNDHGVGCTPGPNWGGGGRGGSSIQPSYDYEAERKRQEEAEHQRLEAERQRLQEIEEQRKRDEEAAKRRQEEFERNKQGALNSMKGITEGELGLKGVDAGDLGLKDIGDTGKGDLGLKGLEDKKAIKDKQGAENVQKVWQKALSCEMEDVYAHVESFGPEGVNFAQELRNEMKHVYNEAGKPVKDSNNMNDVNVVNLHLNRIGQVGSKEGQFIIEIKVISHNNGDIYVDVQGYFSKLAGKNHREKQYEIDDGLIVNKLGGIINQDISKSVKACLAR